MKVFRFSKPTGLPVLPAFSPVDSSFPPSFLYFASIVSLCRVKNFRRPPSATLLALHFPCAVNATGLVPPFSIRKVPPPVAMLLIPPPLLAPLCFSFIEVLLVIVCDLLVLGPLSRSLTRRLDAFCVAAGIMNHLGYPDRRGIPFSLLLHMVLNNSGFFYPQGLEIFRRF